MSLLPSHTPSFHSHITLDITTNSCCFFFERRPALLTQNIFFIVSIVLNPSSTPILISNCWHATWTNKHPNLVWSHEPRLNPSYQLPPSERPLPFSHHKFIFFGTQGIFFCLAYLSKRSHKVLRLFSQPRHQYSIVYILLVTKKYWL